MDFMACELLLSKTVIKDGLSSTVYASHTFINAF